MGESIAARVAKAIADSLGCDPDEVSGSMRLKDDLGADSLDVVQMALQLEEEFALDISDSDAHALATVQDVVDYIERRCAARPVQP